MPPKKKLPPKKKAKIIAEPLETPVQVLSKVSLEKKHAELQNSVNEAMLATVFVNCKSPTRQKELLTNSIVDFPTLEVGHLARAVGLNISNAQVLDIVMLVEHDVPSPGAVPQDRLRHVLVNALMTGVIGGPTLYENGLIPANRKSLVTPSFCVRDDESHIFRAFITLDKYHQGYLFPDELREVLMGYGEPFSEEEINELLTAATDPENDRIYYHSFADILARE